MGSAADRVHERFVIERPIQVARGDSQGDGMTEDLSLGGAKIRVPIEPPLQVGERVRVSFTLPDHNAPIQAEAQVRWVSDVDRSYAGVQFLTGFRAKETWALNRFLDQAASAAQGG